MRAVRLSAALRACLEGGHRAGSTGLQLCVTADDSRACTGTHQRPGVSCIWREDHDPRRARLDAEGQVWLDAEGQVRPHASESVVTPSTSPEAGGLECEVRTVA